MMSLYNNQGRTLNGRRSLMEMNQNGGWRTGQIFFSAMTYNSKSKTYLANNQFCMPVTSKENKTNIYVHIIINIYLKIQLTNFILIYVDLWIP